MAAAALVLAGLMFAAAIVLKAAIRLIFFPLLLIKWIVTALVMVVVGPILAMVGAILALVFALVFALPLLPLVALAAIVCLIVKASRRPAVV